MCQNMCLEIPPSRFTPGGGSFLFPVLFFRHEPNFFPVLRKPAAFMQAPPRGNDKPTIRFRLSIGMSTGQITIKRVVFVSH